MDKIAQKSTICSITDTYQSFSIRLECRLMPFCTFVDKLKYRNNRKYEINNMKMQKTESPRICGSFRRTL